MSASMAAGRPGQPGKLVDYVANNVHADMSFLEMLDVVNEDLIRKGQDPIAFDSDCREGICGSCGLVIDGIAARARQGRHHLPGAHAPLPERRDHHHRAVPRQGVPGPEGPGRRPLGVRPHHRRRRLRLDERRRRARRQQPADRQGHGRPGHGFGAVHRLRRLRRGLQERRGPPVHVGQDHPPWSAAPRRSRTRPPRRPHGGTDGCRRIRQLLERRGMRSGVPEGNLDFQYCQDESRLPQGDCRSRGGAEAPLSERRSRRRLRRPVPSRRRPTC